MNKYKLGVRIQPLTEAY